MIKELRPADPVSVGSYRLLGRLGVGGMGQVYLARSRGGRLVAIKVIRPELAEERGFRVRFASEVAAAKNVSGVYTAAVVDSDPEAEMPWMATAYVPGPSLAEAVDDDGPLPVKTVLALAAGLAEALAAIHQAGVVHRDLKPSNVLLAADGPRVIDFGISLAVERSMLTTTGVVMGSPGYMSPEQARGQREVGQPTDVFSLGAVLAFAASGDGPFGGGSTPALLYRVVNEEPHLARVPARVRPLIERCLAKDPAHRPTPAYILGLLGNEVGVLTQEWLPQAVADTIGRYSPTIETPVPPASGGPATHEPEAETAGAPEAETAGTPEAETAAKAEALAEAESLDNSADATRDIPVNVGVTDAVVAGKAAPPAALARPGRREANRPESARKVALAISAAAAVIVVAVVATILAFAPGGVPKPTAGPVPALVRITNRPAAPRSTTAKPSKTPTTARTRKVAGKPSRNARRIQDFPTPTPDYTPSPAQAPTYHPPVASTTSQAPTQKKTTQAPSGTQVIAGYSGATAQGCSAYGAIGSASGGSGVGYSFINDSGAGIQIWYIASSGSSVLEGTVAPGNSFRPGVATGQDWMVANSGGGCMDIFTITGNGGVTVSS